jgi:hypothetical protein
LEIEYFTTDNRRGFNLLSNDKALIPLFVLEQKIERKKGEEEE